jgi:hypothetical protein
LPLAFILAVAYYIETGSANLVKRNEGKHHMTKLEKIIALAQSDADRTGNTLLVFNLNPYSPLYVIRNFTVAGVHSKELVRIVTPGGVGR